MKVREDTLLDLTYFNLRWHHYPHFKAEEIKF